MEEKNAPWSLKKQKKVLERNEKVLLPLQLHDCFFENFLQVARDFAATFPSKWATIFRKYWGLDGPPSTLREVGEEFGLTRERARQLSAALQMKLQRVLKGYPENGHRCDSIVLMDIWQFCDQLLAAKIMPEKELERVFAAKGITYNATQVELFCAVTSGWIQRVAPDRNYYIFFKGLNALVYDALEKKVRSLLKDGQRYDAPSIRKLVHVPTQFMHYLRLVLRDMPQSDGWYELPFEELPRRGQAYRFLRDHGKFHRDDIIKALGKEGGIPLCLSNVKNIQPVGKTGYWVVKGSGENVSTYTEVIYNLLRTVGRPVPKSHVHATLKLAFPDFKVDSLSALVISSKLLTFSRDGDIMLREWADRFPVADQGPRIRRVEQVHRAILGIFEEEKQLPLHELVARVSEMIGAPKGTCYNVIYKMKCFEKTTRGRECVYALKMKPDSPRPSKEKDALEAVRNLLGEGPLSRRDLVNRVARSLGTSSNFVYAVLNRNVHLFELPKHGGRCSGMVSLRVEA